MGGRSSLVTRRSEEHEGGLIRLLAWLIDVSESPGMARVLLAVSVAIMAATWFVVLLHPEWVTAWYRRNDGATELSSRPRIMLANVAVCAAFVAPFVAVYTGWQVVAPAREPEPTDPNDILARYAQRQRLERQRRVVLTAALVATVSAFVLFLSRF
jgi:hypothetical protein